MLVLEDKGSGEALAKYDQVALDDHLDRTFNQTDPPPSDTATNFIKRCLRVPCEKRMTITEAENHDWLCTPKKHLEFFRKFDKRMMADWQLEAQLKPMPLELQSLKDALVRPGFSDNELGKDVTNASSTCEQPVKQESQTSEYFVKPEIPQHKVGPLKLSSKTMSTQVQAMDVYEYFAPSDTPGTADDEVDLVSMPPWTDPPPSSLTMTTSKPQISNEHPVVLEEAATQSVKHLGPPSVQTSKSQPSGNPFPWSVTKPRLSYKGTRKFSSRKEKVYKAQKFVHDHFAIPISNLDRHLPQNSGGPKREQVLEEVYRSKRQFLKNSGASKLGFSPPSTSRARAEPDSKRRRTRHDE